MTAPKELDAIRDEVTAWLDENWDPELTLREWWARTAASGWGFPTWPREWYGRGLEPDALNVVGQAFQAKGAIGAPAGLGHTMGGPVVIEHGDDDQRARFTKALAAGEESWCQFFSEPGSGSDLASAQTRAIRDGDEWIVNGQKVWTSGARQADRGMLVARVDPDQPKHKGLGYFIIPVDQPGIEVRPLKQMTGGATFNEVFFTDARVAHDDLIGRPGDGWAAALTTLAYERGGRAGTVGAGGGRAGSRGEQLDNKVGDMVGTRRRAPARGLESAGQMTAAGVAMMGVSPSALAKEFNKNGDPVIRQRVVQHHALSQIGTYNQQRARAESAAGKPPGATSSITKLFRSGVSRLNRDLGPQILGAHGMLAGEDAPHNGAVTQSTLQAPSSSIAGGTDEIQHNIIGERVLALPKEPEVDRNTPFRDLKIGTQRSPD